jgi:FixJ family two-component response regulator
VNDRERFGAVELAVAISPSGPARTGPVAKIRECIETLTPREAGVFALVVTRILNKQTARELGIVEKTVKVHRARGMEAMRPARWPSSSSWAGEAGVIAVKL